MSTASAHCWRGALGSMAHSRTSDASALLDDAQRPRVLGTGGFQYLEHRQALGEIERLAGQEAPAVLGRDRTGEEVPLRVGAAERAQLLELRPAFDPLGD